jgi:probable HAF family extracellular repeat protein
MKTRIFMYTTALAVFAVLMAMFGSAAQGQTSGTYTVQVLPDLGGLAGAASINDLGWTAGESNPPSDLFDQAIVWRNGQLTQLGTLGGFNSSVAFPNKNEIGWLVGGSETADNDPYQENFCGFGVGCTPGGCAPVTQICKGFLWQSATNEMIALPPLRGGNNSIAFGANNQQQVVGAAENGMQDLNCAPPQVFHYEGVVWSLKSNGAPFVSQLLAPLKGDTVSGAAAINKYGDIVGVSGPCQPLAPGFPWHAVLWQNGRPVNLGSLGGVLNNVADALNNLGQIVGLSDLPGDNLTHPFLWQGGVMSDLGTLRPSDTFALAESINESGEVVGQSCGAGGRLSNFRLAGNCHGFHWQAGVMIDLNSVIPANSALVITNAADINSTGQIAVQAWEQTLQKQVAAVLIPSNR